MNHSTPGLPVHHQLLEFTQTHVHWVGDAIQPSHPLLSPSPPDLNLSQHQGVFKWVSSLHQVAKVLVSASTSVLPMNTQDWFTFGWTGWISSQSKGLSRVFSNSTVQKHQFFGAQFSLYSNSHIHTWLQTNICMSVQLLEKIQIWLYSLYYMIVGLMSLKTVWDTKCLEGFWLLAGKLQKAWMFGLDKAWLVWDGYSDLPSNLLGLLSRSSLFILHLSPKKVEFHGFRPAAPR